MLLRLVGGVSIKMGVGCLSGAMVLGIVGTIG